MTRLPRTSKLDCPVCRAAYALNGCGSRQHAKGNIISHMERAHGLARDDARKQLVAAGIITEGCPLEQAIKDEAELKARGVLE